MKPNRQMPWWEHEAEGSRRVLRRFQDSSTVVSTTVSVCLHTPSPRAQDLFFFYPLALWAPASRAKLAETCSSEIAQESPSLAAALLPQMTLSSPLPSSLHLNVFPPHWGMALVYLYWVG